LNQAIQIDGESLMPDKNFRLIPTSIILTKTCQGKVMKEKLKSVKTASSLFILHSSFSESLAFAPRNISFHRPKDHVSPPQT
jgi:hypothetical protein